MNVIFWSTFINLSTLFIVTGVTILLIRVYAKFFWKDPKAKLKNEVEK